MRLDEIALLNLAWTHGWALSDGDCPYFTDLIGPPKLGGPERSIGYCIRPAGHGGVHRWEPPIHWSAGA